MDKNLKEIKEDNILNLEFKRDNCYFLVTNDDFYKLQVVNNIYAQDPDKCEYAFCPFSYSGVYFGGHIGDPIKIMKSILRLKQGRLFQSGSNRGVENLYLLLVELLSNSVDLSALDKIKYEDSLKLGYDVGYIRALLKSLKNKNEAAFV